MDIDTVWPESSIYHSTDHQQQTYVTKHDLALLHKKIIATDLIVQKYQEANKALLSLQIDNDALKQQNDQITNECCIFGKQVTESTQECDNLKEQIDILNDEKRELHRQLRLLQDQNTNYYHEIMILKQYESLKEINDESTKTIARQQKDIARLQLKLQRKSPIVYKPNKSKQEPSETDIALIKSQKSVRELKLALGRLVNFIQTSKIEIPISFHIRPVLKAHEINDDFLESEGEFVLKPVTTKVSSIPVISQTDDEDDDDDGDFIDVIQPAPVPPPVAIIEEIPIPSKSSSQQKEKKTKKSKTRRVSKKLDDLANELEKALSKSDQLPNTSHPSSFFSDDDEEDRTQNSNKQQVVIPIYNPIIEQLPTIDQFDSMTGNTRSHKPTISSFKSVSFLSDDDDEDRTQNLDKQVLIPIYNPTIEQQPTVDQFDSITKNTISHKPAVSSFKSVAFLSDDDDEDRIQNLDKQQVFTPICTPTIEQQPTIDQLDSIAENTISSFKSVPFLSDDENSPIIAEQQSISFSPINEKTIVSLQVDSITPIENEQPKCLSFLSEDDDDNKSIPTPIIEQPQIIFSSSIDQEFNNSISDDDNNQSQQSDKSQEFLSSIEKSSSNQQVEISPLLNEKDTTIPSVPANTLDSKRIELVLRLLHVLTQVPIPLKPLRLSRRRIQRKKISEEKEKIHSNDIEPSNDRIPEQQNVTNSEINEEQQNPIEEQVKPSQIIPNPQESMITAITEPMQIEQTTLLKNKEEEEEPIPPSIPEIPKQSLLNPAHISIISRLLNILTTLPVKPLSLPLPFRSRKRKHSTVVPKPSVTLSRPISNRISRSPSRMQTRSLTTIRACIARCNKPTAITHKRTATESISPSPISKRIKSTRIEEKKNNNYDIFEKFLASCSKEINDELRKIIELKLHEEISLLIDHLYRIISDFMIKKCDMILPLVKHLHPYEESMKILFTYINSKSAVFQHQFIVKLNQIFEYEIKQKQASNNQIKVLNRLFFLSCSIFASSSITTYARLFDIGCYLSHDILIHALSFLTNQCSSLISLDAQKNSSNILLHRILFDIFQPKKLNISLEYLENLLRSYHTNTHDQEDLIRSFLLISRHQSWLWCSNELCSKLLCPLLNQLNEEHQRLSILIILQFILMVHKDNDNFKQDIIFHDEIKRLLLSLKTMTNDECTVRDKIFFILQTCS